MKFGCFFEYVIEHKNRKDCLLYSAFVKYPTVHSAVNIISAKMFHILLLV